MQRMLVSCVVLLAALYVAKVFYGQWSAKNGKCGNCGKTK